MDPNGSFLASMIATSRRGYASMAIERQLRAAAGVTQTRDFAGAVTEAEILLDYLCQALATGRPKLFLDHIAWLKASLSGRDLSTDLVARDLESLREELSDSLPPEQGALAVDYLEAARAHLDSSRCDVPTFLPDGAPHVELARQYLLATLEGRSDEALAMVLDAQATGMSFREIHSHVLRPTQAEIGRMWQLGDMHTSEEHLASRTFERVTTLLAERTVRQEPNGKSVLVASVGGNLHDIGVRVVSQMFELAGWRTVFLGANTLGRDVVRSIVDFGVDLLALSAAMALHIRATADLITDVRATTETAKTPILVGGHPFASVPDLWEIVGADAHAPDAMTALELANGLVPAKTR